MEIIAAIWGQLAIGLAKDRIIVCLTLYFSCRTAHYVYHLHQSVGHMQWHCYIYISDVYYRPIESSTSINCSYIDIPYKNVCNF